MFSLPTAQCTIECPSLSNASTLTFWLSNKLTSGKLPCMIAK